MSVPKKYIEIEDLVFALPDDFEGSSLNALEILLEYILKALSSGKKSEVSDADSDRGVASLKGTKPGSRVSIKYRLYELNSNTNEYEMKSYIGNDD